MQSLLGNGVEGNIQLVPVEEEEFRLIENPAYQNQLSVLNVLDESFEVDMVSLYNEFMLAKNRNKRKYFQNNFALSLRKTVLKGNN